MEQDEYEDEDFEDYDEDFEDEEEDQPQQQPPSRTTTNTTTNSNNTYKGGNNNAISSSDHALYAPDKYNHSNTLEQSKPQSKATKQQYNDVPMSLNTMKITDPRLIRIQKLLETQVMELNTEKHTILNTLSCSLYDLYMRNLRLNTSTQRQIGVPIELEKRDIDCNTDSIDVANKSIQYSYGDDTVFYQICDNIKKKKLYNNKNNNNNEYKNISDTENTTTNTTTTGTSTSIDQHFNIGILGATRFTTFLQNSSRLFEHLLTQNNLNTKEIEESKSDSSNSTNTSTTTLLDTTTTNKGWSAMDKDRTNGGNEMIRTRRISCVKFSTLQSHIVMTAHPYPTDEQADLDLKPYKVRYWMLL